MSDKTKPICKNALYPPSLYIQSCTIVPYFFFSPHSMKNKNDRQQNTQGTGSNRDDMQTDTARQGSDTDRDTDTTRGGNR